MKITRELNGKTSDGQQLELVTLENDHKTIVKVTNLGGIITSMIFNSKNGEPVDIALGFDNSLDYLSPEYLKTDPHFGAVIGRYANRIKNAKFQIDGVEYQLAQTNGADCLHGGVEGFDKRVWEIVEIIESPELKVKMKYVSPDGEENFPGNLTVFLTIGLNNKDEISIAFDAETDKATAVNLTHHGYFNLNGGKGQIGDHLLTLNSSNYLEQDANYVTNGNLVNVKGTAHDFTSEKPINRDWDEKEGYDQSFVIDDKADGLKFAAKASSKETGIVFEVFTTDPVVHLYCGLYIPEIEGKYGINYGRYSAFCLETQIHPNAINVPSFPNTVLRPGEKMHSETVYKLSYAD
ncbi:aldose epimerase family protein [Solitalea canadensis]|uniref:Aldose 1-epimerase n=1 Tax=Solitalea canadensis (strain ATCC 29591 / DSM 3403 / JCM 21819 / LMG 8368 / NBRC 15130 / NCIMB 12057 / USAM 9D) TaxID=929556 RepID=H8KL59_SOLCM|nr:aldose epimerase family protein [Solitalea canadensis]AFD09142.1 galactose mutarotase-like enzyme [Solitalea canadensis DSM 3403]